MKYFLTAALILGLQSQAWSTIALVAHTSQPNPTGTNTQVVTSTHLDCSTANFLIIITADFSVANSCNDTVGDSQGNSYTCAEATDSAGNRNGAIFYKAGASVGSSMTFNAIGNYASIYAACFSGVATSSVLDQVNRANTNTASITPLNNSELVICGLSSGDTTAGNYTVTGTTKLDSQVIVGGVSEGGGSSYIIQSGAPSSVTCTWGTAGGVNGSAVILATFNPSSGVLLTYNAPFFGGD